MTAASRWYPARVLFAAALSGAAVLMVEMSAVRAMAPLFGASSMVWTNVIGVVLVALALGYGIGGRWADRRPDPRVLGLVLFAAAAALVPAPFLLTPLGESFFPARVPLAEWQPSTAPALGSVVTSALLFAPPVILLGMVSPFAVRLLHDAGIPARRAASRALAVSTAGSLVGTYLPAHLLFEHAGIRGTILVAAFAMLAAGLCLVLARRPGNPAFTDRTPAPRHP